MPRETLDFYKTIYFLGGEKMYKYDEEYQKVVQTSKDILDGAKAQYESMAKKYNEETLQAEAGALLRRTNEDLLSIKRTFIKEAQEGLQTNKNTILERRDIAQQSKTVQDKILQELEKANTIQQLESQLILATTTGELLDILNNITDPTVFEVVKGKAYTLVDKQGKTLIKNKKYVDPQLSIIDQAILEIQYMDRDFLSPILPMGVDSVETFVTGVDMSNFFFGGVK